MKKKSLRIGFVKRLLALMGMLLAASLCEGADVQFLLSQFNASPATNRTLQLQAQSPFIGNLQFYTSDTNGSIIYSNMPLAVVWNATIKAPPGAITFQLYLPSDTPTGLVNATNYTSVYGISTYPAGAVAPSYQAADARYQRGTNSLTLGNLTSTSTGLTIANGANSVVGGGTALTITNLPENLVSNLVSDLASKASTNQLVNATNDLNTQLQSSLATKQTGSITLSNATTLVTTNPATILYTNALPGLTNGLLAIANAATTNNLATTNYVQALTNTANAYNLSYFYPTSNPNGFLTGASIPTTNNLATTNYVQTLTNTQYGFFTNLNTVTSNGLQSQITSGVSNANFIANTNGTSYGTLTAANVNVSGNITNAGQIVLSGSSNPGIYIGSTNLFNIGGLTYYSPLGYVNFNFSDVGTAFFQGASYRNFAFGNGSSIVANDGSTHTNVVDIGGFYTGITNSENCTVINDWGGVVNNRDGGFYVGRYITPTNDFAYVINADPATPRTTAISNSISIYAQNGVGFGTNNANGNMLSVLGNEQVIGSENISGSLTVGGTNIGNAVASLSSLSNSIPATNYNLGNAQWTYQSTNVIVMTNNSVAAANWPYIYVYNGAGALTNLQGIFITNNGSSYLCQNGATTLCSSPALINSAWTNVSGGGAAATFYGGYQNIIYPMTGIFNYSTNFNDNTNRVWLAASNNTQHATNDLDTLEIARIAGATNLYVRNPWDTNLTGALPVPSAVLTNYDSRTIVLSGPLYHSNSVAYGVDTNGSPKWFFSDITGEGYVAGNMSVTKTNTAAGFVASSGQYSGNGGGLSNLTASYFDTTASNKVQNLSTNSAATNLMGIIAGNTATNLPTRQVMTNIASAVAANVITNFGATNLYALKTNGTMTATYNGTVLLSGVGTNHLTVSGAGNGSVNGNWTWQGTYYSLDSDSEGSENINYGSPHWRILDSNDHPAYTNNSTDPTAPYTSVGTYGTNPAPTVTWTFTNNLGVNGGGVFWSDPNSSLSNGIATGLTISHASSNSITFSGAGNSSCNVSLYWDVNGAVFDTDGTSDDPPTWLLTGGHWILTDDSGNNAYSNNSPDPFALPLYSMGTTGGNTGTMPAPTSTMSPFTNSVQVTSAGVWLNSNRPLDAGIFNSWWPVFLFGNDTNNDYNGVPFGLYYNNGQLQFNKQDPSLGNDMPTFNGNFSGNLSGNATGLSGSATLTGNSVMNNGVYLGNNANVSFQFFAGAWLLNDNITNTVALSNTTFTVTVPNTVFNGTISASTNVAPYQTISNPTNSYVTGTLYTNLPQRTTLVGSVHLVGAVTGSARIDLLYTNNGTGYALPMMIGAVAETEDKPFCVPLSTNATFKFLSTMGTGASGYVTNAVNWQQ